MDINALLNEPVKYLKTKTKKEIINFLQDCDIAFFNTNKTLLNDDMYDLVKNYLKNLDPKNAYFKRVGADEDTKVKLPYWMGSLDKIKDDEKAINNWKKKYNGSAIVSDKLDGISCLFYKNNETQFTYEYIHQKVKILTSKLKKHKKECILLFSDKSVGYYISVIYILF